MSVPSLQKRFRTPATASRAASSSRADIPGDAARAMRRHSSRWAVRPLRRVRSQFGVAQGLARDHAVAGAANPLEFGPVVNRDVTPGSRDGAGLLEPADRLRASRL